MASPSDSVAMRFAAIVFLVTFALSPFIVAQHTSLTTAVVPNVIRFAGTFTDTPQNPSTAPLGVTFALYKDQEGGSPLWLETQNVTVDQAGHYSVLLGTTKAEGIPTDVFANGEARWLGVTADGQKELPRVLIVSVPYALKAGDAETLGGMPASAYVLAPTANTETASRDSSGTSAVKSSSSLTVESANVGTSNYIGKFVNTTDLINSTIFEDPATFKVGVGTTTPAEKVEVNGNLLLRGQPTHQIQLTGQASQGRFAQNYSGPYISSDTAGKDIRLLTTPTGGSTTAQVVLTSAGRVGIGTLNPAERLELKGNLLLRGNVTHQIQVIGQDSQGRLGQAVNGFFFASDSPGKRIGFYTTPIGGSLAVRMSVLDNGKVGIGTTEPNNALSVAGTIESTSGGVMFPNGSVQSKAGVTNVIANSGISGGGTPDSNGNLTLGADFNAVQARVSGACSSGTAIGSIASNGTVSCNVVSGTGGALTLPFAGTGTDNPPTLQGVFKITNTANGPANQQGPPDPTTVPGAVVGVATGTGITSGIIGLATGANGVGLVGLNNGDAPAVVAWNQSTGNGDGLSAMVASTNYGAAVNATAMANTGYAMAIQGEVNSASGVAGYFVNHANGPILSAGNGNLQVFGVSGTQAQFQVPVQVNGSVSVNGTISANSIVAGSKNFKIDDPTDPANKWLYHTSIESPDMKNLYDGLVILDKKGEAWVTMPDWFEALNRDFRYQLTAIGAPGPRLYVAKEISGNRFKIAGGKPGMKVSWLVTGIRHDAWAVDNRSPVEVEKIGTEVGSYYHPKAITPTGSPDAKAVASH